MGNRTSSENKNVSILGDFNMHINNPDDADANILTDTQEVLGFHQHIDFSTHQWGKHSGLSIH